MAVLRRLAAAAAAADFAVARDKLGATQNQIAQIQSTIDADKSGAATLRTVVSARADAQQATAALQAKLDQEIAVAATAEQAQLAAERAQLQAAQPARSGGAPGQILNNPVLHGAPVVVRRRRTLGGAR